MAQLYATIDITKGVPARFAEGNGDSSQGVGHFYFLRKETEKQLEEMKLPF